jgi:hypothetical protein
VTAPANRSPWHRPARRPPGARVRCHQCGSLFSGQGNPDCERFDRSDAEQTGECGEGEACLWYSWEMSRGRVSYVRECFSTAILLGDVSDPLLPAASCNPRDVSETPTSVRIQAGLSLTLLSTHLHLPSTSPGVPLYR